MDSFLRFATERALGWIYKESSSANFIVRLNIVEIRRTGFFPALRFGKGLGGGFTRKTKVVPHLVLVLTLISLRTGFFPPLRFGKGLGVALQGKPRSLRARLFLFYLKLVEELDSFLRCASERALGVALQRKPANSSWFSL